MSTLKYKNDNNEWVEVEIRPHRRIEITDNDDNRYEIKPGHQPTRLKTSRLGSAEIPAKRTRLWCSRH
jgi:hypothetical protein